MSKIKIYRVFLSACVLFGVLLNSSSCSKYTRLPKDATLQAWVRDSMIREIERIPRYVTKQTYQQDSIYFTKVLRRAVNEGVGMGRNMHDNYDKEFRDSVGMFVEELFYSPDSLKVFVLIIIKNSTKNLKPYPGEPIEYTRWRKSQSQFDYDSKALIGCRRYPTEKFLIYEWAQKTFVDLKDYKEAKAWISNFYYNYNEFDAVVDIADKPRCGLKDVCFWDDVMFRKDYKMYGYYDFQISCYIKNVTERICEFEMPLNGPTIKNEDFNPKIPPQVSYFGE